MTDHCIYIGEDAGNKLPSDASYMFEFKSGALVISKQMTRQEYKWLTRFLAACDNNLGTLRHYHDPNVVPWNNEGQIDKLYEVEE